MEKGISLLLIVLTLILFSGCKSSRSVVSMDLHENWQQNIITVDGNDNEWEKPLKYNDGREKLTYSITNDSDNVYICFKTNNNVLQFKMLQSGFMVYLNNNGQKRETAGIYFPMGSVPDTKEQGIFSSIGQCLDLSAKREMFSKQKEYSLFGFARSDGRYVYETPNEDDIIIRIGFNEFGEFVYEASVPFKAIFHNIPSLNDSLSINLAVGFFIRGLPRPEFSGGSFPPNGVVGPGGDSPGRAGAGEGQETQGIQMLFQDTKVWKVIPLASIQGKKDK